MIKSLASMIGLIRLEKAASGYISKASYESRSHLVFESEDVHNIMAFPGPVFEASRILENG